MLALCRTVYQVYLQLLQAELLKPAHQNTLTCNNALPPHIHITDSHTNENGKTASTQFLSPIFPPTIIYLGTF
jgi:hypothetical protein